MEYTVLVQVAVRAAQEAAQVIREAASDTAKLTIDFKGKNDLVTEVDRRAQDRIVEVLMREFPDHAILAEEGDLSRTTASDSFEFRWIVDPLDGTTNFTRGVPPYAVSIGLERAGEAVLGVVLNVPLNECFVGHAGGGVSVNGALVRVSSTDRLQDCLLTTGFPYRELDNVDAYMTALKGVMRASRGIRRPGSASVDLAYVACGRFDGFFETGLMPWDVAAGTALIREAGGTVSRIVGDGNPLFAGEILATNGLVHDHLRQLVAGMSSADVGDIARAR